MKELRLERLPGMIPCRLAPADLHGALGSSCIDTRRLQKGDLFWALKGEKVDGHAYVSEALAKGAQAAVVREDWFIEHHHLFSNEPFVVVDDPLKALQELAREHRQQFSIPVIGLTGTNGKTSTKELLAAALGLRYRVLKSVGNLNNHIGVPLTLLQLTEEIEMLVCELGTNHPGEIKALCDLALPTVGLVLNVSPAHLEGLTDVESVAREKAALYAALPPDGVAFVNLDDPHVRRMTTSTQTRVGYHLDPLDDPAQLTPIYHPIYHGQALGFDADGKWAFQLGDVTMQLNWLGRHQLSNALAAAVVALHFGVPLKEIATVFTKLPPLSGRLNLQATAGVTLIDDSYNANPASTQAALNFLKDYPNPGRKWVVLGDHLELGNASEQEHRRIGQMLIEPWLEAAFFIGHEMQYAFREYRNSGKKSMYFAAEAGYQQIAGIIAKHLTSGDAMLIKASRGMGLDQLVAHLQRQLSASSQEG